MRNITFNSKRRKKQTVDSFVSQNIPHWNNDIVISLMEDFNMTSSEATAHIVALWNVIQDMFYMHQNFDLGCFSVKTITSHTGSDVFKRIRALRRRFCEPYFTNCRAAKRESLLFLRRIEKRLLLGADKFSHRSTMWYITKIKNKNSIEYQLSKRRKRNYKLKMKHFATKFNSKLKYVYQDDFSIHNYQFKKNQQIAWN